MLAQVSDGKLQLGELFDDHKFNVDHYKEIIDKFNTLDLSKAKYLNPDNSKIGTQ